MKKTGYFDPVKTGHLISKFMKGDRFVESETQNMALIGILSTQILHQQYIESNDARNVNPQNVDKRIVRKGQGQ